MASLLLASAFVIATCGLVYELIAGTLASYLLGDSVTQFSLIIGFYLFSMGVGSYLSKFIRKNELDVFIGIETLTGVIGGWSATLLFFSFEWVESFRIVLFMMVAIIGILVGIEIPLLLRMLKNKFPFDELIARVFALDYVGALVASVLFPLVLVPYLGLIRSAQLFGLLNIGVGLWCLYCMRDEVQYPRRQFAISVLMALGLFAGFIGAGQLTDLAEAMSYAPAKVIYSRSTPYQKMTVTHQGGEWRLYLNGNLQFSSRDEYRYHEALVHVGLSSLKEPRHVLVLGGGDGMAVREILKYSSVTKITLVDLDPAMTKLFTSSSFSALNDQALMNPRVTIVNDDAYRWLNQTAAKFDFVVIDFPDPSSFSVGKLFSTHFFERLKKVMSDKGLAVIQSSSPLFAREAYWCVVHTIQASSLWAAPYHSYVPSFGEWGFVLLAKTPHQLEWQLPSGLRYVTTPVIAQMFQFPSDMSEVPTDINRLNNQALVRYFDANWSEYVR